MGLCHSGSPGKSVGDIREEQALAGEVGTILAAQPGGLSALHRLHLVRETLGTRSPGLIRAGSTAPFEAFGPVAAGLKTAAAFVGAFLWPFTALFLLWMAVSAYWASAHIDHEPAASRAALAGL